MTLCKTCGRRLSERFPSGNLHDALNDLVDVVTESERGNHDDAATADALDYARSALMVKPCPDPIHDLADRAPEMAEALDALLSLAGGCPGVHWGHKTAPCGVCVHCKADAVLRAARGEEVEP